MATIKSPVEGYKGTLFGVEFEDGAASTEDERLIAYFTEAGYDVSGAEGYEVEHDPQLDKPIPAIGTTMGPDVPEPPRADAANPENDLVPVGGVKSDGTIVAGAQDEDGALVAPKPNPSGDVQETGNPDEQSAVPSSTNPSTAAVSPSGVPLGTADPSGTTDGVTTTDEVTTTPADSTAPEASQDASGGIISSDPAVPADSDAGKHAADAPVDGPVVADTVPTSGDPAGDPAADVAQAGAVDATSSPRTKKAAS